MLKIILALFLMVSTAYAAEPKPGCADGADSEYKAVAKDVIQNSHILSLVPEILDLAQVKDLIPILSEVETRENKSVSDYLMLVQFYERLGQPEKQIKALEEAVAVDPDDPRPKLLLANQRFSAGAEDEARQLYRDYLASPRFERKQPYLVAYVAAMAYPLPVLAGLFAAAAGLVYFLFRKRFPKRIRLAFTLVPAVLTFEFLISGHALPFGLLICLIVVMGLAMVLPPVVRFSRPVWGLVGRVVASLFTERFARSIAAVPPGWRVLIALLTLFVMGGVAPAIPIADARYAVILLCVLLFFGTVGSLVVTFVRSSDTLRNSLRWIGISATIPFLMIHILSRWPELGTPLTHGRLPSQTAIDALLNHVVMWGVSVVLAIHLSKILSDALVSPVREMMWKVTIIEQGDFNARVVVRSRDEIGALGEAVNRMAVGLARRELVERTFRRYVDARIADKILKDDQQSNFVAGQLLHAVVLFADIRGFTSMSEKVDPTKVVMVLNECFERIVGVISANGAVVDKFIGDNVMAVWGVPTETPDGELKAVKAAQEMQASIAVLSAEFEAKGLPAVAMGIGINAGPVVAGSIGSRDRMEYTVIGDVVNTAQRAESGALAGQIVVTESVFAKVKHLVEAESVEDRRVKGKAAVVRLYLLKTAAGLKAAS